MVNPLSHLENLAERLVEGTVARLLGARLQPIEVARYLARAMEDGQVVGTRGQVVVPNACKTSCLATSPTWRARQGPAWPDARASPCRPIPVCRCGGCASKRG
jgi:hypothetical protein